MHCENQIRYVGGVFSIYATVCYVKYPVVSLRRSTRGTSTVGHGRGVCRPARGWSDNDTDHWVRYTPAGGCDTNNARKSGSPPHTLSRYRAIKDAETSAGWPLPTWPAEPNEPLNDQMTNGNHIRRRNEYHNNHATSNRQLTSQRYQTTTPNNTVRPRTARALCFSHWTEFWNLNYSLKPKLTGIYIHLYSP